MIRRSQDHSLAKILRSLSKGDVLTIEGMPDLKETWFGIVMDKWENASILSET